MPCLNGKKILISDHVDQAVIVPAKKHRRRRIQKKWRKRFGTKTIFKPSILMMNDTFIMSPWSYDRLKKLLEEV